MKKLKMDEVKKEILRYTLESAIESNKINKVWLEEANMLLTSIKKL